MKSDKTPLKQSGAVSSNDTGQPGQESLNYLEYSDSKAAAQAMGRVLDLIIRLRAPDGCPWDREQTPQSAARYLIEEAFEAVEAIEACDTAEACSELGDLIFQAAFIAQIYADQKKFNLAQALDTVHEKMVRRHPHVFGEQKLKDSASVLEQWGRIKKQERQKNGEGLLDSVPQAAPALLRAQRLGQKAAGVGFDWHGPKQVWDKVLEELDELKQAGDPEDIQAELGDLLFALAQWARHMRMDAEAALRDSSTRFQQRFKIMENMALEKGQSLEELDDAALDQLWEAAKAQSKTGN